MADDYRPGGAFVSNELLASPRASARPNAGRALIRCVAGCDSSGLPVPGGLIHDWLGGIFIPGVSLQKVLALVRDYDHAADHYAPNVTKSRLVARSGDLFRVLLQLKQTEVVTVRFDTEYDVHYVRLDASRVYSISHSTRVAQPRIASRGRRRLSLAPRQLLEIRAGHGRSVRRVPRHFVELRRSAGTRLARRALHQEHSAKIVAIHAQLHASRSAFRIACDSSIARQSRAQRRLNMAPSSFPLDRNIVRQMAKSAARENASTDAAAGLGHAAFRNAERVQQSLTARFEKKVLLGIALGLPLWVTSDQLTCLGLSAMLFGWGSYLLARWYRSGFLFATLSLALNWFGDSLDGTLARVRNQQRPRYGFYVDHVIDSLGAVLLMSGPYRECESAAHWLPGDFIAPIS
jgi:hypothetical protein